MALDADIAPANQVFVPEATSHSTGGDIEKIREQALAVETSSKIEMAKVEDAGKAPGSDAFSVVGQAALSAIAPVAGMKEILTTGEFAIARAQDRAPNETPEVGAARPAPQHIEKDIISSTARTPGLYSANVGKSIYGGNPKVSRDLSANIAERANIAASSLQEPKSVGLHQPDGRGSKEGGNWAVDQKKTPNIEFAKQQLASNTIANERALQSTIRASAERNAALGAARSMAPGMGYNLAPKRTSELLGYARDMQEDEKRA